MPIIFNSPVWYWLCHII